MTDKHEEAPQQVPLPEDYSKYFAASFVDDAPVDEDLLGGSHDLVAKATLQEPIKDPAQLEWNEVSKVAHYYLSVNAMTRPMQIREDEA